jgi:hypothetical protein
MRNLRIRSRYRRSAVTVNPPAVDGRRRRVRRVVIALVVVALAAAAVDTALLLHRRAIPAVPENVAVECTPAGAATTTPSPSTSATTTAGARIVPYASLPAGSTLQARIDAVDDGDQVSFPTGVYRFRDFHAKPDTTVNGLDLTPNVAGIRGAGVDRTVFEMTPHSSTAASLVPTQSPQTNQLSLVRVQAAHPVLSDFTLCGTNQGHLYNGIRMSHSVDARVTDVDVVGIPGDDKQPPGETFGINDYRTTGSVYRDVRIDGAGIGASGFGANASNDVTIVDSSFVHSGSAIGATFYRTDGVTVRHSAATGNATMGLNFEQTTGAVLLDHVDLRGNGVAAIHIAFDQGASYTIEDPTFSGSKLVIATPEVTGEALGAGLDLHVLVHGVDRTAELVEYIPG